MRWTVSALGLALSLSAQAIGVTPLMLDLERNPLDALAQARQALQVPAAAGLQAQEKRLEWQLQATFATAMLGDAKGFEQHLEDAQAAAKELADPYALAFLRALQAGKAGESGKADEAVAGAHDAAQMAERISDPLSKAFVRDMCGWALLGGRRFAEAEPHLRAALEAYIQHGAVLRRATTQAAMGSLFDGLRDSRSAYRERQAAYDLIHDLDAPYLKSYLTWSLGKDALLAGEPGKAQAHFEMSVRESARMKDVAGVGAAAEQGLGLAAADQGRWTEALNRLETVQPRLLAKGYISLWVTGQAALARAQAETGRGDPDATLAAARSRVQKMSNGPSTVQFLEREAGVMRSLGRPGRAAELLADVLTAERQLFSESRQTQLSELMVRYDVYKKQVENAELRLQKELADARISQQNSRQQLLVAVLALGSLTGALLIYILRQQVLSRRHFSELALSDSLTGSPNRRAIIQHLGRVLNEGRPGLVCMLDMDHFKRINDDHGHPVGDLVLKAFFEACCAGAGPEERVGRMGGEEWLLVAVQKDTSERAAHALFDRIRRHFHALARVALPRGAMPTFSMGAVRLRQVATVSEMLADTDRALYVAKEQGRDRWVLGGPGHGAEMP